MKGLTGNEFYISDNKIKWKKKINNVRTEENRQTFDSFIPKDDRCMYVTARCFSIILIKKEAE